MIVRPLKEITSVRKSGYVIERSSVDDFIVLTGTCKVILYKLGQLKISSHSGILEPTCLPIQKVLNNRFVISRPFGFRNLTHQYL